MTDQENRRSGPTDGVVIDDCQWLPRDVLRCGFLCRECTVLISAVDLSHEHFNQIRVSYVHLSRSLPLLQKLANFFHFSVSFHWWTIN